MPSWAQADRRAPGAPSATGALRTRGRSRSVRRSPACAGLRFISESSAELKKVEWPGQNQVVQGTVVVLVACIIVGAYLWINDQIWKEVVPKCCLGQ